MAISCTRSIVRAVVPLSHFGEYISLLSCHGKCRIPSGATTAAAADAEAICEAVRRPTMRFVQIKSTEQQGRLMLHRARDLLMRQRTQVINAMRAHLAELGIVAAQGRDGIKELLKIIANEGDARLPVDAHASLVVLAAGLHAVQTMLDRSRSGSWCSIARTRRASGWRPSPE